MKLFTKKKNVLLLLALILSLSFCLSNELSNPDYELDLQDTDVRMIKNKNYRKFLT